MKHNIFLSWSGNRSKWVATAFLEWLPYILQSAKPWMSAANIDKGTLSLVELSKPLEALKVGITFLTPENLQAPWIHYEAGALTKSVDDDTRLYTYLLAGLRNQDIRPPLGRFQHTMANKPDTLAMVESINRLLTDEPLPVERARILFERFWPDLEAKLKAMPEPETEVPGRRDTDDMVAEILEHVRAEANARASVAGQSFSGTPSGPFSAPLYGATVSTPSFLRVYSGANIFFVQRKGEPVLSIQAQRAEENPKGSLTIFDSTGTAILQIDKVERWWEA